MRNLFVLLVSLLSLTLTVQAQKYIISTSNVHFFSSAPLENIEANNTDTKAVLDAETHSFSFRVPISSFTFEKALMQEHFNENYMESDKYPNGSFKGAIEGEYDLSSDGEYDVVAIGTLDIHGVSQERTIDATITVTDGVPNIKSKFVVKLVDHKIKIPKVVFYNIAEEIEVTIDANLKKYEKN